MDDNFMSISKLINHLEILKKENPNAKCAIGENPKSLMVIMGEKTVLLKLGGEW